MTSPSIVDLFKNSSPRSKLFIQLIPPGFGEEDFKELIKEYLNEIDYMVFRPGKIIRDQYGHLIGLDCPNYGFATINFKNPRSCPKFHREFHQLQLSDSFSKNLILLLDIKSKLFIEFALMQKVPETLDVFESKENFRDLAIFKEFLKTFPFAAKAEEDRDRLAATAIVPVEIDLEDETILDLQQQFPVTKISELDAKLSISIAPILPLPQVSFSSLLAKNSGLKGSAEVVTPLTEFIKTLSLNEQMPPANKKKEKKEKERRERKIKEKKNRKKEEAIKAADKSVKTGKLNRRDKDILTTGSNHPQSEKKSFNTNKTNNTTITTESPQIKGVPKILARKPVIEAIPVDVAEVSSGKYKPSVPSARPFPYLPSSNRPVVPESINSVAYAEYLIEKLPPTSNRNDRKSFNNNERTKPIIKHKLVSAKKDDNGHESGVVGSFNNLLSVEAKAYAPRASHVMSASINADPFVPSAATIATVKQNSCIKTSNQSKKQSKGKTLAERSTVPSSSSDLACVPDDPVAVVKPPPKFKQSKQKSIKEPVDVAIVIKPAQTQPNSPKIQPTTASNPAPVKNVFTSSAKMRESKQNQ